MSCTSAQGIAPFNASRVLPDQFGKTWVLPPGVRLKRGGFSYGEKKEIEALARSGDIRATIRGLVSQVPVTDGDDIVEGDLLIVLEAMKMLNYKLPVTRNGITITMGYITPGQRHKIQSLIIIPLLRLRITGRGRLLNLNNIQLAKATVSQTWSMLRRAYV